MPITEISYQPVTAMQSAYRPIIYRCRANTGAADRICPVVYCDIYVNSVYFKTLAKTQFVADDGVAPEYEFDIQDAMQELMEYVLPKVDGNIIEEFPSQLKSVFVKFRNAVLDPDGFTVSEQDAPVMATSSSVAVTGAGTPSAKIVVMNALIQHEENQNLSQLLASFRTGIWSSTAYPLTRRPKNYQLCKTDSSHFPIVSDLIPATICVWFKDFFGSEVTLCKQLLTACPVVSGLAYVVVNNGDGRQTLTFSWANPVAMAGITGLDIYAAFENDEANGYELFQGSADPPRNITVPLGKYTFRFGFTGSCVNGSVSQLPGLVNIGLTESAGSQPPTGALKWQDTGTSEDRTCGDASCPFYITLDKSDPDNDITAIQVLMSIDNGASWSVIINSTTVNGFGDQISTGSKWYKVVITDSANNIVTTNTMKIRKNVVTNPVYNFYYKSRYPDGRPGYVTYIDMWGEQHTLELDVPHWEDDPYNPGQQIWVEATCTWIEASSIVSTVAAVVCTP